MGEGVRGSLVEALVRVAVVEAASVLRSYESGCDSSSISMSCCC